MMRAFSLKGRGAGKPSGFSLVEIMVALVIGMIGVLVIMQVARTAEAQKRVTTGSGEAQNNAALAVYSIEWDLKQAGYGLNSTNVIGQSLTLSNEHEYGSPDPLQLELAAATVNPSTAFPFPAVPAGVDTDRLLLVYGNNDSAPLPLPGGMRTSGGLKPCGDKLCIGLRSISSSFFAEGDHILLVPPPEREGEGKDPACKKVMGKISEEPEDLDVPGDERMGMIKVAFPVTVEPSEDANCVVFNLGKDPRFVGYAVNSDGELVRCDFLKNDCQVIASGIVSLKAELTGDGDFAGSAVRFALVARNSEPDKEEVTTEETNEPTWKDGSAINVSGAPVPAGFTWKNYRYQVYETVVPLMNVQWRQ